MNHERIRAAIALAEQATAEAEQLVPEGGRYQLTADQQGAIHALCTAFEAGERAALLEAPTGSGKTAVAFHVMLEAKLAQPLKPVTVLAPTRDLARQWVRYLGPRLAGTPLRVAELHGGIAHHEREQCLQDLASGQVAFLVASGLPLQEEALRAVLRGCALVVADDLHAFDVRVHLKRMDGLNVPLLALSATPEPVAAFVKALGADQRVVRMTTKPFDAPTTHVREARGFLKMPIDKQLNLASAEIQAHLDAGGRIYLVARMREGVPKLAAYAARVTGAPVFSVHGDMADSVGHARRTGQGKGLRGPKTVRTRIEMLESFRNTAPSILVGTNLIAAGLDVPEADLLVLTDADGFGPAEREQLIGRVGRRDLASEAVLVVGTLVSIKGSRAKPRPTKPKGEGGEGRAAKAKATPEAKAKGPEAAGTAPSAPTPERTPPAAKAPTPLVKEGATKGTKAQKAALKEAKRLKAAEKKAADQAAAKAKRQAEGGSKRRVKKASPSTTERLPGQGPQDRLAPKPRDPNKTGKAPKWKAPKGFDEKATLPDWAIEIE